MLGGFSEFRTRMLDEYSHAILVISSDVGTGGTLTGTSLYFFHKIFAAGKG